MPDYADEGPKKSFILPFATPAADRFKDFTKNMEMAAILHLAESSREKGERYLLKKPDEKLVFLTKAWYPIWLIPYNGATLLFDGFGITSHAISYDTVPDVKIFNEDIEENQKTTEAYTVTLSRNVDYFKDFTGKEEKNIEGLIATPDFIKDFATYLLQMKETQEPFTAKAVLTPLIEDYEIQVSIGQLSNLRKKIDEDIENIDASMRLLNTTTVEKTKAIREEIKKTREKHDTQIEKIKPRVTRKISQIQNKYHRKITRTSKRFKDRLQRLRKNQVKLQKTLRHLRTEAKRCETRIQSRRRRKRKQTESQWTLKLKRIKKKLPTVSKGIKRTVKKIQDVETAQKLELAQVKTECDARIEAANKPFRDLRSSKEAEITMKQQEIATLEDMTSQITSQMREIAETKKVNLAEFDKLAIPRRRKARALVYVPFYLVRYEKEDQKRYVIYPPSFVGTLGTLTKMKGALGAPKMKALLQPRSEAMTTFLNQLVARIAKNPMLEKEVTEACIQDSILLSKQLRIGVKKGLKELEKENWMSKNELQTFSEVIYIYA
jgi:uncharacterized protein YukE